jgi:hypothetical protein
MVDLVTLPLRIEREPAGRPGDSRAAHDVLNRLKYAFAIAAADLPVTAPGPVDLLFREFLSSRAEPVRARQRAGPRRCSRHRPPARGDLRRYGRIEPAQYAAVGLGRTGRFAGPLGVDAQRLETRSPKPPTPACGLALPPLQTLPARGTKVKFIVDPNFVKELQSKTASTQTLPRGPRRGEGHRRGARFKKLGLFIKEVECIESNEPSVPTINRRCVHRRRWRGDASHQRVQGLGRLR